MRQLRVSCQGSSWTCSSRRDAAIGIGNGLKSHARSVADRTFPRVAFRDSAARCVLPSSPDGKWVTYNSDETGRNEVYVTAFPPTDDRRRVSTNGGVQGRWRGDSAEILYLALDGTLMATSFAPGNPPQIGTPVELFKTGITPTYNLDHFDVAADGKRILVKVPPSGGEQSLLKVLVNWTSSLPRD